MKMITRVNINTCTYNGKSSCWSSIDKIVWSTGLYWYWSYEDIDGNSSRSEWCFSHHSQRYFPI